MMVMMMLVMMKRKMKKEEEEERELYLGSLPAGERAREWFEGPALIGDFDRVLSQLTCW